MRNITVAISDKAYYEARIWAAYRGSSISAVTQLLLENLSRIPKWVVVDLHNNVPLPRSRKEAVTGAKSPDVALHPNPQPAPSTEFPREKPVPVVDFGL
jgi:hypothetical protein